MASCNMRVVGMVLKRQMSCWLGLLLTLAACKQVVSTNTAGFILGPADDMEELQPKEESIKVQRWFKSTVLISTELIYQSKRKFCSGSLIGPEEGDDDKRLRVLTNFHCFAQTNERGVVGKEFLPEACANTQVFFGFSKDNAHETESSHCEGGTLIGDFTGDLAVFKLTKNPPKGYKPLALWDDPNVPAGREALIIHHPDIKDRFATVGDSSETLPAASITEQDCRTNGDFATDEWQLDHTLPYSTKHTCDLVHGSSGSALIDKESGKLLGVNWGGIEIKYKDKKKKYNAATKGYYVAAFLKGDLTLVKQSSARKARDAESKREQKERTNGGQVGGEINKALCGTLVGTKAGSFDPVLLFLLLALPALIAGLRSAFQRT